MEKVILECSGLAKSFGRKQAVKDFSLKVHEGDVIGLIGPNGAGKSTILKMITGLIWPDAGNVSICGYDVHSEHAKALANVGAIIEWPSFMPDISARRNLQILSGGHGAEYEKKMKDIINFVELTDRLNDKVGRFSTGMKQRLGIALALLPDSKFIILDEPTNGLDPGGIIEIRSIIREHNRKFGTTTLITSHLLGEIENTCNRIALIKDGVTAAAGTIEELLEKEIILKVITDSPDDSVKLLEELKQHQELPVKSFRREEDIIYVEVAENCAPELNSRLVYAGISVHHLSTCRKKLEQFFMETTTGGGNAA